MALRNILTTSGGDPKADLISTSHRLAALIVLR
jgi:hypothetical protein